MNAATNQQQSAVTPFIFEGEIVVRTATINGDPWFVAGDVCKVLGISKPRDAVMKLDNDERVPVKVDTLGGQQEMVATNESGLFTLILRSRDATTPGTLF